MAGIAGRALEWGRIIVMVPPEGIDQNARGIFLRAFFCYSLQQYPFPLTIVHFLARTRKRNQKKAPVSRFLLRVDGVAGARGNSPAFGGLRQSARLFPSTPSMLGAGQREIKKTRKAKPAFKPSSCELPEDSPSALNAFEKMLGR